MATKKYPPRDQKNLILAAKQLLNGVGDPTEIGLNAADITRLDDAVTDGETNIAANEQIQAQAKTSTKKVEASDDLIDDILSEINGRVQKHPNMTDERRTAMGLPVYDKTRSKTLMTDELPDVSILINVPLQQEIRFGKKPKGVNFLGIFSKIGGKATGDIKDYQFQAQDRTSPYIMVFDAAQSGEQVHYLFCWINNDGDRGAFRMMSATITSELQEKIS